MTRDSGAVRTGIVVDGKTRPTTEHFAVHDPADPRAVVGYAAAATVEETREAIRAAHAAWPGWAALPPARRAELLTSAVAALSATGDERIELLVRENGKPRAEAEIEMHVFAGRCELAAGLAPQLESAATELAAPPFHTRVDLLPLGVVSIIVPFNWPLAILGASLPYALVAGNTAIVKPPPTAPLATVLTLEQLAAHLPPGVLGVVTGDDAEVGPVLVGDPLVAKVVFTGSTATGKRIMAAAAESLTRLTLELGGNDPAIVLPDAEVDGDMIGRLVAGSVGITSGQVCMAIKQLYVHRSRYDAVVEGLTGALSAAVVGPGLAEGTTMGPLNNARQRDTVARLVGQARDSGAEVRELGRLADGADPDQGYFLRPTLVLDPDPALELVTTEQFGPALPIIPFDDENAVLDRVNGEWAGLCSSVWSNDVGHAADVAARLRTGTTWINAHNAPALDDRAPFGGFRQSGIGREMGLAGLLSFTESHSVTFGAAG